MTEDQNDQTNEGPAGRPQPGDRLGRTPETTSQAAIPLPAALPRRRSSRFRSPSSPTPPRMGRTAPPRRRADPTAGSTPPQGTYAMGALAGNPMLGAATGIVVGRSPAHEPRGADVDCAAALGVQRTGSSNHRVRNGLLAGAAALAVLGAGFGIGHATTSNGGSTQAFSPTSGSSRLPSQLRVLRRLELLRALRQLGEPVRQRRHPSATAGSLRQHREAAARARRTPRVRVTSTPSHPRSTRASSTSTRHSATSRSRPPARASCSLPTASILTNNHVIDGATSISVTDVGNHKTYTASVVGYDRTKDIAVLQLQNASGLQTATLGNSSNASVGENVVGIGNAGGTGGTPSAVGGTVTALNQSITASDDGDGTSEQLSGLIETNADIQPGDSGGSLVNTSGDVIGMDTAASAGTSFQYNGQSSSGTQGFAIPIDTALSIAKTIEEGSGSSTVHIGETAFLGVEINAQSSSSGDGSGEGGGGFGGFFGGNSGSTGNTGNTGSSVSGASVASTVTNGPAQEAGLAEWRHHHLAGWQDDQLAVTTSPTPSASTTRATR